MTSEQQQRYRGVKLHGKTGRWQARIYLDKREISLGYHATPEQAACAYDAAAVWLNRRLNFPAASA